jgi:hypothetical protein
MFPSYKSNKLLLFYFIIEMYLDKYLIQSITQCYRKVLYHIKIVNNI